MRANLTSVLVQNDINDTEICHALQASPIFNCCQVRDLAKLIPALSIETFNKDEIIYEMGENAHSIYLLKSGKVMIVKYDREIKSGQFLGLEAAVGGSTYITNCVAAEETVVYKIEKEALKRLYGIYPEIQHHFHQLLFNLHHTESIDIENRKAIHHDKEKKSDDLRKTIGWCSVILFPSLIIYYREFIGLDWGAGIFLGVFLAAVGMWIFRLYAEFIPSIFAILVVLILGLAPPSVALSGFTSSSFFMAMSVFGLGIVLVASGITYRLVLLLLSIVPTSKFWYVFSIYLLGTLLTPIIPSANGRVSLASPLLKDMIEALGYKRGEKAATQLSTSVFTSLNLFSTVFLSSKTINFVVIGLLPLQIRNQFSWGYWFFASIVSMIVMGVLSILIIMFSFKSEEVPRLSKEKINLQLKMLGPLDGKELFALIGVILFIIGIATSSIHKIESAWIGLAILYISLAFGMLSKKEFQKNIDWPFLIYLGGLIGLVNTMNFIGLDKWFGSKFEWMLPYMREDFSLFVFLLIVSILLVRIIVPNNAAVILFVTIFLPMADQTGMNPWVIGFIILTISNTWFFPYQCSYYILFKEELKEERMYNEKRFLVFNAIMNVVIIFSIYASLPFWRFIKIL